MKVLIIEPGIYDRNGLATVLQDKLRTGKHEGMGTYTVSPAVMGQVVSAAGQRYLKITLEGGAHFELQGV